MADQNFCFMISPNSEGLIILKMLIFFFLLIYFLFPHIFPATKHCWGFSPSWLDALTVYTFVNWLLNRHCITEKLCVKKVLNFWMYFVFYQSLLTSETGSQVMNMNPQHRILSMISGALLLREASVRKRSLILKRATESRMRIWGNS